MKKVLFFLLFFVVGRQLITAQIITTVAGGGTGSLGDGGAATAGRLGWVACATVDKDGNIYVADATNNRIRRIDASTSVITTVAGTGSAGFSGDGGAATAAMISTPGWVACDTSGNFYIGDSYNYRIRRVDISTGIISTFAGTGTLGYSGDGGAATAADIGCGAFVFDRYGNLYTEDGNNFVIRKIDASGVITTIAGTGTSGSTGDGGPATAASFNGALGICTDSRNIWLQDNWTAAVRRIDLRTGVVTRVAGAGDSIQTPYSGDGTIATAAHFGSFGIVVDSNGDLFISDYTNNLILKVDTVGHIYAVAGNGSAGFSGDGGPATSAQISHPQTIAIDMCNNAYVGDAANYRVRKVLFNTSTTDTPTLTITASTADTICAGTAVTYTATHTLGGTYNTYQWYVNATAVSGATDSFYTYTPSGTDGIFCAIATWNRCSSPSYDTSNTIRMVVNPVIAPAISITVSPGDTVCAGTAVTCTAATTGSGTSPAYQWYINGSATGTSSTYSYTPANGDSIRCVLTSSAACVIASSISSSTINMVVQPPVSPAITITPSPSDTLCNTDTVTFMATVAGGGSSPAYQWFVNGVAGGTAAGSYIYPATNGDSIRCVLTSNASCASPATVTSNTIYMSVAGLGHPAVTLNAPAVSPVGSLVTVTATVTGAGSSYIIHWLNSGVEFTTTTIPTVTYTKTQPIDTITAKVVSLGFCYDSTVSGSSLVYDHNVGVSSLAIARILQVYPNPAGVELHIAAAEEIQSVTITNVVGQVLYTRLSEVKEILVDVSPLSTGVYFLKATLSNGNGVVRQFLKE